MMRNAIIAILALSMMSCGGKKEETQTVQKEDSTQAQPVKVMVLSPQKIAKTLDKSCDGTKHLHFGHARFN